MSALPLQQNNPTVQTVVGITCLLNYCATYLNTAIRYHASGMVPCINSNASYLTALEVRSRVLALNPKTCTNYCQGQYH
eukprot:112570-Ditylum_brightwellii.AAC.1